MARILIATAPVAGHVTPGLSICRSLVSRGHEVWWYTGRKYRSAVERSGARFVAMQRTRVRATLPGERTPPTRRDCTHGRIHPRRGSIEQLAGSARMSLAEQHV